MFWYEFTFIYTFFHEIFTYLLELASSGSILSPLLEFGYSKNIYSAQYSYTAMTVRKLGVRNNELGAINILMIIITHVF